jgi:hypothetical protein
MGISMVAPDLLLAIEAVGWVDGMIAAIRSIFREEGEFGEWEGPLIVEQHSFDVDSQLQHSIQGLGG